MINLLVYGHVEAKNQYKAGLSKHISELMRIHVFNSIHFQWSTDSVVVMSNLDLPLLPCAQHEIDFDQYSNINPTVYKWVGIYEALNKYPNDIVVYHDCDCYQVAPFVKPEFDKLGMARYAEGYNTGFVIANSKSLPIVEEILTIAKKEGPTLVDEKVVRRLSSHTKEKEITEINSRYNVGVSNFSSRYQRAEKPIIFIHAHLERKKRFSKFQERGVLPQNLIEYFNSFIFTEDSV